MSVEKEILSISKQAYSALHIYKAGPSQAGGLGGFSFWQVNSPYLHQGGRIIPTHCY